MRRRDSSRRSRIAVFALAFLAMVGCGYSEDEWQAKLKEIDALQSQMQAEQQAHRKSEDDYNNAKTEVDELKERLRQAGVDVQQLNASLAEQRRALEEYKRRSEQLEAIKKRYETLRSKLDSLVKLGLSVSVRGNRMVITMPGDVLFDSGKEDLRRDGEDILRKVAEVIRGDTQLNERTFQVAGHTDSRRPAGGTYKDNWHLSVMRARRVLIFLVEPVDKNGGGLSPVRWSAAGYGDTDPVAPNASTDEMRRNRRVELVVLPNVEEMLDLQSVTQ